MRTPGETDPDAPVESVPATAPPLRPPSRPGLLLLLAYALLVAGPLLFLFGRLVVRSGDVLSSPPPSRPTAAGDLPAPVRLYPAAEAPPFPNLQARNPDDGTSRSLLEVAERPALFHFFSLACESCARDWPELRALLADESAGLPPIILVLVVPDELDSDTAAAAIEETRRSGWFGVPAADLAVHAVVSEAAVLNSSGPPDPARPLTGYPETLLLDERGRIRLHVVGPIGWNPAMWRDLLVRIE